MMKNLELIRRNMKVFLFGAFCLLFLSSFAVSSVKAQPSATFERIWVDYNIKEANQDGMRIHVKFTANSLKAADCQIRVVFYYDEEGEKPIMDKNQRFYTTKGYVAAFRDLKPAYDPAVYSDFQLFMPYDELDLSPGNYNLKMDVDLIYKDGELIEHLTWHEFTYKTSAPVAAKPSVVFDRMWVEYDVTEGGQLGMRIHSKFTVNNMKGIPGYLVFFFERANGTRLKSYDKKFESKGNDVALYREITPGYDPAVYADYSGFIPYSEFHLAKGQHNLKIDAQIIYENGTFIQHLGYKEFVYWKK